MYGQAIRKLTRITEIKPLRAGRPVATGSAVLRRENPRGASFRDYAGRGESVVPRARARDALRISRDSPCAVAAATAPRVAVLLMSALILAACAPTIHMDVPNLPALPPPQSASDCTTALNTEKIAPLDPPPQLPDALQAPCPLGSGLAACFTLDQDLVRQKRFKILHDDRDYCRDAYDRARERSIEQSLAQ